MPRDYKNIKKDTPKKESKFNALLTFLSGLSLGLLVAVLVFFYGNELASYIEIERRASVKTSKQNELAQVNQSETDSPVPEPTFTFYNILPNREVDISAWIAKTPETNATLDQEGNYILQVGSFKKERSADRVKAKLALLGFNAYIEPGVVNGEGTFRVRIGPYDNLKKLKSARERLLANDLEFMQIPL
jgi:cell division protein FtsN